MAYYGFSHEDFAPTTYPDLHGNKKRKQDDTRWGVFIIPAGRLSEDLDVCLGSAARWADIHKAELFDLVCDEWIYLVFFFFSPLYYFFLSFSSYNIWLNCVFIVTIDDDGPCSVVRCKYMLYQTFPDNKNGEKAENLVGLTSVIWAAICLLFIHFLSAPPFFFLPRGICPLLCFLILFYLVSTGGN